MLACDGKTSVTCFLLGLSSCSALIFKLIGQDKFSLSTEEGYLFWAIYSVAVYFLLRTALRDRSYDVGIRGAFLGSLFSAGLYLTVSKSSYSAFGWYMCVMSFFHFSEFVTIALSNPDTLSIDSYILNHSPQYKIAAVCSWIEFWIEHRFWPELKDYGALLSVIGLLMCIGGEAMRKLAMLTAKTNFNHIVQSEKQEGHTLITGGVYSICRHPAYAGWFYWAIGTQLILVNPICTLGYIAATWKFFNDRITIEEVTLLNFFQYDYIRYQEKVPTGLPFIKGYLLDDL